MAHWASSPVTWPALEPGFQPTPIPAAVPDAMLPDRAGGVPAMTPLTYRFTVPAPIVPAMYVHPDAGTAALAPTLAWVLLFPNTTAGVLPPDRKRLESPVVGAGLAGGHEVRGAELGQAVQVDPAL